MDFTDENRPKASLTTQFKISTNACRADLHASLPALANELQEIAGEHAAALGIGIQALQSEGFTWMLGRLSIKLHRSPAWRDTVSLTTWPSGVRGRLMAERHFVLEDATGERLLEASSEWLYVNFLTHKLARIPDSIVAFGKPGILAFDLCGSKIALPIDDAQKIGEATFAVRRSDIDTNRHVNNVHYTEWMMESLPEDRFFGVLPAQFDIEYKQAAVLGDTIIATSYAINSDIFIHKVCRANDGVLLAIARSTYTN